MCTGLSVRRDACMVRDGEVSREEWRRQSIGMSGKGELDRERRRLVVEGKDCF